MMTAEQLQRLIVVVGSLARRMQFAGQARFDLTERTHFRRLLARLAESGYVVNEELAVAAALAAVALAGRHPWPPPPELVRALARALLDPENRDPREPQAAHVERAPEFVVAFLLGWERCPGPSVCPVAGLHAGRFPNDLNATGWTGLAEGARLLLRRRTLAWVTHCLEVMWDRPESHYPWSVPGFPYEEPYEWTDRVLATFLSHVVRCDCAARVADNAANARRKVRSCLRRHNIDVWDPADETLWRFVEKGVKGFHGSLVSYPAGFPAGMLHHRLWQGAGDGPDFRRYVLLWVPVVERVCGVGNHRTVAWRCHEHKSEFTPADHLKSGGYRLILDDQRGGFISDSFWACFACGNLFSGPRGPCPRCHSEPARGSRSSTYYHM
jgi:hypothetical protein